MLITSVEAKYLKIIYKLEKEGIPLVGAKVMASILSVSRPSAHEILLKLRDKGFLEHYPRKGFRLSKSGRRLAKRLVRNHKIIETMLVIIAGISVDEACRCAENIELKLPSNVIEKIFESIGRPECCPHGEPIPPLEECAEMIEDVC